MRPLVRPRIAQPSPTQPPFLNLAVTSLE
jgi:hypothetical protein